MRLATRADIPGIMEIVAQSVAQMHSEGNTRWDENYPGADDFLADIEAGTLYVAVEQGVITGFICINTEEPMEYGGVPWRKDAPAMVVHRMAIATQSRGKGIATRLLRYGEELAKAKGIGYIKVDTYSKNPAMNHLLVSLGYVMVGHMHVAERPHLFHCYDKEI